MQNERIRGLFINDVTVMGEGEEEVDKTAVYCYTVSKIKQLTVPEKPVKLREDMCENGFKDP